MTTQLIQICFALTVLLVIYWALLRPVLLDAVSTDITELAARMDWAIIDGLEGAQSKAGMMLEEDLRDAGRTYGLSLSVLIYYIITRREQLRAEVQRDAEIFAEVPHWMINLRGELAYLMKRRLLINSPIWWIPAAFILLLAMFSGTVKRGMDFIVATATHNDEDTRIVC